MQLPPALTYAGHDGTSLYYRKVAPAAPKAAVIVVHGYSGHSGRYLHILEALSGHGMAAYCPDHRGHGLSAKLLGLVDRFDDLVEDLDCLRALVQAEQPGVPVYIFGHSMGGTLSVLSLARSPGAYAGGVLSAPAVLVHDKATAPLRLLAHALGIAVPSLGLRSYFKPELVARSEAARQAMIDDPLFYKGKVRARTASQMLKAVQSAQACLPSLTMPLLLMHGQSDHIVPLRASQVVMEQAASQDKTLRIWPDSFHQLLSDPEWQEVVAESVSWIERRT